MFDPDWLDRRVRMRFVSLLAAKTILIRIVELSCFIWMETQLLKASTYGNPGSIIFVMSVIMTTKHYFEINLWNVHIITVRPECDSFSPIMTHLTSLLFSVLRLHDVDVSDVVSWIVEPRGWMCYKDSVLS